jgi:hypothetical protein
MPVIYMTHPIHGAKMATMEEEAVYDEQNGWTRYNPDTPSVAVEEAAPVNALEVKRRARRAPATPMEEVTTE